MSMKQQRSEKVDNICCGCATPPYIRVHLFLNSEQFIYIVAWSAGYIIFLAIFYYMLSGSTSHCYNQSNESTIKIYELSGY